MTNQDYALLFPIKEAAEAARPNTNWTLRSIDIEE